MTDQRMFANTTTHLNLCWRVARGVRFLLAGAVSAIIHWVDVDPSWLGRHKADLGNDF